MTRRVADEVRAILTAVDPDAIGPDTFWGDICDSIEMGDWETDEVEPRGSEDT